MPRKKSGVAMRTNCSATIYNKYVVAGAEKYQRAVLVAVAWENRKGSNIIRSGLLAADSVVVYVPFSIGTNYVAPRAWQALETKTGYWTLQIDDVMVKGTVTDEISAEFTMTALKAKYDDVVRIKSVDTMDMGSVTMRHFQVGAS